MESWEVSWTRVDSEYGFPGVARFEAIRSMRAPAYECSFELTTTEHLTSSTPSTKPVSKLAPGGEIGCDVFLPRNPSPIEIPNGPHPYCPPRLSIETRFVIVMRWRTELTGPLNQEQFVCTEQMADVLKSM